MSWLEEFWKKSKPPKEEPSAADPPETKRDFPAKGSLPAFTPRAQQVLVLARREAARLNHNFVGTEHLLLGLIAQGQGCACNVLRRLGVSLEGLRAEVEKLVGNGPDQKMVGNIPYTPRTKKVLALAAKEMRALNHQYVGTEHILLGVLREGDGLAARALQYLNVNAEETRLEILRELGAPLAQPMNPPEPEPTTAPKGSVFDASRRYDVYCREQRQEMVVYRNVLFLGRTSFFPRFRDDPAADFLELEQANGQRFFIARSTIIKFCEHGATPGFDVVP